MLKPIREGYTIRIKLPEECGYEGYSVKCIYKYHKKKEKYLLSMWLKRDDINEDFKIDSQEIDTQYISGTQETIEENICRIVEQASLSGYFDHYIERYEYTNKCFERGNELFELERLNTQSKISDITPYLNDLLLRMVKNNSELKQELITLISKYESLTSERIGA